MNFGALKRKPFCKLCFQYLFITVLGFSLVLLYTARQPFVFFLFYFYHIQTYVCKAHLKFDIAGIFIRFALYSAEATSPFFVPSFSFTSFTSTSTHKQLNRERHTHTSAVSAPPSLHLLPCTYVNCTCFCLFQLSLLPK